MDDDLQDIKVDEMDSVDDDKLNIDEPEEKRTMNDVIKSTLFNTIGLIIFRMLVELVLFRSVSFLRPINGRHILLVILLFNLILVNGMNELKDEKKSSLGGILVLVVIFIFVVTPLLRKFV